MTDTEVLDWIVGQIEGARVRANVHYPVDQEAIKLSATATHKTHYAEAALIKVTLGSVVLTLRRDEPITRDHLTRDHLTYVIQRNIVDAITEKLTK